MSNQRVGLITGASSGVGQATAPLLAPERPFEMGVRSPFKLDKDA
jgi:NAD(P)-dependent dehydrogenase (short-subunit alcohol dehydrogenase family)